MIGPAPLPVSCLSSQPIADQSLGTSPNQALGSFSVSSQEFGEQTFAPTVCTAGDRQYFLGADLSSPSSKLVLCLVVDRLEGPAVRVALAEAPFDNPIVFRRAGCKVFHFSLETTGWWVNEVYDFRLTLEVDCRRSGERLIGTASSTHCH
jgi:hypothetical protein